MLCYPMGCFCVAGQALLSTGLPRQEYWSGVSLPSPVDLPNPGIEPESSVWQADSLPAEPQGEPVESLKAAKSHMKHTCISRYLCNGIYIAELKCAVSVIAVSFIS